MTFPEKLRQLRDAAGMSEAKLAQASGVSFASIHEYGLGRRKPSFAAVVKIARALGVTCETFADCEDIAEERDGGADRPKKRAGAAPKKTPRRGPKAK
jgi:transcriptional regulator with XRE-family HTH domain